MRWGQFLALSFLRNSIGLCTLSFFSVGLWWFGFAQIPFAILKETKRTVDPHENIVGRGWNELKKVLKEIQHQNKDTHIKRYLWGFFFTSMGLQTVMYVASLFGAEELHLSTQDLIITVLIIQLIAVFGAQWRHLMQVSYLNRAHGWLKVA